LGIGPYESNVRISPNPEISTTFFIFHTQILQLQQNIVLVGFLKIAALKVHEGWAWKSSLAR
jgi:hypothetical protein